MAELYRNPEENAAEYAPAEPRTHERPDPLPIDRRWMLDVLVRLLQTPSPSGRTDAVMQFVGDILTGLGVPFRLTRRGALIAELKGESPESDRALVAHADTIGAMIAELKDNGRLRVVPIGTFSPRFASGARVKIFVEDPHRVYTGTIMPLKASGHRFGDAVDDQKTDWDHVEVRVDQRVSSRGDLEDLGLQVGDTVALSSAPEVTDSGFVVARHLDGKAGVAIALAVAKAVVDGQVRLPHTTELLVTISEEVGHGASNGLNPSVAEMVSLDNSVVAPGQESIEHGVTVAMGDLHGPYDYHLTRRLDALAEHAGVDRVRDVFRYYRSDAAAAIEAGAETRAALLGFGVDGSHGWERTEVSSLSAVADVVSMWLQTPLTFAKWDAAATGPLHEFPSSRQPSAVDRWSRLPEQGELDEDPLAGRDRPAAAELRYSEDGPLRPLPGD